MTISATSRFFILLCCCIAVQFSFAQTYLHPTAGLQSTFAGNCEVNLCSGVYTDDGGTGGNYANNVNNIYRTFCPSAPGQCIRLTFTQFSLEAPDFFGDCYDYLTIGSGPTQNSPVVWQGCGTTLPPAITSTDPSGCLTMRFVSDAVINAAGWRANITCVPCAGGGPSALLSNDCANAQYVCDNLQPLNANSQGPGLVSDACVSGCAISENYSNWFILNVTAVGTMGFTISPTPTIADYDFTLYGPVAGGCANLGAPIRCSYAANTGATGMRAISSDPSEDVNGDGWVSQANMAVGTYYLLINQWAYEPSSTFRLDFNGTSSIGLPSLNISSNSPVCDNLPLQLTGPLVQGATYSWTGPSGWTSNQRSPTRNPPVAGTYNFSYTVNGCTSPPISLNVVINPAPTAAISPTATSICPGQNITLTANGGASYAWSNSANTQSITVSPAATTNYTVTVTAVGGCTATATQTVTVNSNLAVVINPSAPAICNGANTTLTATGGTSYTWSNSANTPGITVNPTTTTTYTVTATNGASCTGTASATVTVNANPVASVLPATISICNGASTTLTASGGTSYAWSNSANTASITVNPITTTTYTATVTNANGCTATASGTVTVNALPVATINPATTSICSGQTLTLTAGGGTSYAWSTSENTAGITVSPTINTTYTVTVTNAAGCTATATRTITVNASPIALINPAAVSICTGISTTLSASGGTSYAWSNAANTPGTSVAPTATTTYTVTVSNISGCMATATSTVTVNALPIATISPATASICSGASATLTANGGITYAWNNSENTQSITVSTSGNYVVTVTDANNCTASASRTVTVNSNPAATILPLNVTLCTGASATLTASGGTSYLWSTTENTPGISITPAATTTYSVTVTDANNCTATASRTVNVNALPVVAVSPASVSICNGANSTLTASGANSYVWSTTEVSPTITVNPATTTTYTVTATDVNSCSATASATVMVNALPITTISPSAVSICAGENTTLTGSGGGSFTWSTTENTTSIIVAPITTTTYSVTITDASGCTASASATVTVNQNPVAAISPAAIAICQGASATLTASGGVSYVWSNSAITQDITIAPTTATIYSVTVTDGSNCTATDTRNVTVNTNPVVAISPASAAICDGGNATLTASGGATYLWSNSAITQSITVNPASTTSYSVTATDVNSCSATASATVTVNALPITTISPSAVSICAGENTTLTGSGGGSFTWSTTENTTSIIVAPITTTTYSVTITDASGCTASASATVTVNQNPVAAISPAAIAICEGASATLTASGGVSYVWSNSAITQDITIAPTTATIYSVTVTDGSNCTATDTRNVTVNTNPVVAISPASAAICDGGNATLTASGGATYLWSNSAITQSITVNPASTTSYSVTATDVNSCSATASATVTVNTLPITTISPSAVSICAGENTTLTGSGGGSFTWSTTENTTSIIVAPITTTTYSVTITDASGCTASASATVTVNQNPVAAISPAAIAICEGASATLTASGGVSYVWSNSAITQDITIAPTTATIYSVTVTDGSNCTATDTRNVTVNTNPVVAISPASAAICDGGNATLTASGGATYLWSNSAITQSITVNPASTTSYSVTATDANSCSATASATVTVNTLPNATISPATASICTGSSATLTANGGTTYLWSTTEITLSITVSPLATTTYSVTVTDANSCSVVVTRDVNVGASLVVNISPAVVAICEGASTTLTASGGTSFVWSTTEITSSIIVSPLAATTYSVTASDVSGCTGTASRDVTVNTNPTAVITPATVSICAGENATLNATGGINYSWSTTEITPVITVAPITTSTYDVTVTDINGCTASTSRDVTVNALPIAAITPASSAICEGANTTLTASGGVTYAWSNGLGTTQTVPVSPAATTSYFVTVTDVNNCEASTSEIITVNTLPLASIISTPSTICEGGSSSLFATGGTSYAWSTTEITPDILVSPNTTSTYSVTVTDANNCSATTSSTVQVNANPLVAISPASSSICGGQNVPLSATGATTYLWSTSEAGTTITVSPFATTNYSVTGTDANNCTGTGSSTVDVLQSVTITPIADDVSCNGESDGAVNITVNGGQLPYSYLWSNGAVTQNISGVPANNYSVTVTDAINCGATAGAIVAEPNAIAITETIADISCLGEADGAIDITLNGGATPYAYAWSDGDLNEDRINLSSGNYSVEVMDANSCAVTADYFVREGDVIILNATETNPTCAFNGNDGTITVSGTGGTEPYTYAWSNGNGAGTNAAVAPGDYTVTVTDDNGCAETADFTLTYEYVFTADAGNGATITVGQSVTLGYTTAGNAGNIVSNIWSPAASLNCGACPEPDATPEVTTLYTITVLNEEGCPATDTIRVTVIEEGEVVAPNVFTPDGDGNNDDFQIYGNLETIKFFEAQIYNRWGEKIFESNDPTFKWNGIYRGNLLRPDVYIYQVRLNTLSNSQVRVKKGSVTLMR